MFTVGYGRAWAQYLRAENYSYYENLYLEVITMIQALIVFAIIGIMGVLMRRNS